MIQKAYRRYQSLNTDHYRRRKILAMEICEKENLKKELLWWRHKRRLRDLFASRDNRAAIAIQRLYRRRLSQVRKEKRALSLATEENYKKQQEQERRNRVIGKKQMKDSLLRSKLRKALETARQLVYWKSQRIQNNTNEGQLHCVHSLSPFAKIKNASPLKRKDEPITIDGLKQYTWFNIRLERTIYRYRLDPFDILRLHDTSFAALDFLGEDSVDVVDFYEFIGEPRSKFSTWLLSFAHLGVKHSIDFTEYTNLVALVCLMGRDDLLRLLFCSVDKEKKTFLTKEQWIEFVSIMTEYETITHATKSAIHAFERYGEVYGYDRKHKLFFNGFKKILQPFPFIAFPMLRLQAKIKEKHFGEKYWKAISTKLSQD